MAESMTVEREAKTVRMEIRPGRILRFRKSERLLHWAVALPFLVCLGSGLALYVFYNASPDRAFREVFSWAHKVSGAVLIVAPILVFLVCWRDTRVYVNNLKEGWVWSLAEIKWLLVMPLSLVSKKVQLPEENKFNAGEKLNFMATTLAYPIMSATGVVLWLKGSVAVPYLVHFAMSMATLPLVGGHIFMATINPATRKGLPGMLTGLVDREWAKHHYRRWYRKNFTTQTLPAHGRLAALRPKRPLALGDSPVPPTSILHRKRSLALGFFIAGGVVTTTPAALFLLRGWAASQVRQAEVAPATLATVFLTGERALLSKAEEEAAPVPGEPLLRGAKLLQLEQTGFFARVKDLEGREGFLPVAFLAAEAPPISSSYPFPDCHRGAGEPSDAPCRARAEAMLVDCKAACQPEQLEVCPTLCEERQETCDASCSARSPKRKQRIVFEQKDLKPFLGSGATTQSKRQRR